MRCPLSYCPVSGSPLVSKSPSPVQRSLGKQAVRSDLDAVLVFVTESAIITCVTACGQNQGAVWIWFSVTITCSQHQNWNKRKHYPVPLPWVYLSYKGSVSPSNAPARVLPVTLLGVRIPSIRKVEFPFLPTPKAGICT